MKIGSGVVACVFGLQMGCASTMYVPPEAGSAVPLEVVAEFHQTDRADAAQVLAFRDPVSCDGHPRGIFLGRLCPNVGPGFACKGMSLLQHVDADTPITIKLEYKFGDITTEHGGCGSQFTFVPRSGSRYRVLFRVDKEGCGSVVQKSTRDGAAWEDDGTVAYDRRPCLWL